MRAGFPFPSLSVWHRRTASVSILASLLKPYEDTLLGHGMLKKKRCGGVTPGRGFVVVPTYGMSWPRRGGGLRGRQGDDAGGILQGHGVMVLVSTCQDRRRSGSVPETKLSSAASRSRLYRLNIRCRTCHGRVMVAKWRTIGRLINTYK